MTHRIFGIPIEEALGRVEPGTLPPVLRNIFTYLNAPDHIGTEGLFRVSAGVKELENLKTGLDAGDTPDLKRYDAHLVAGLLKAYFIELPEPLFTFGLYDSFIAVADNADRTQLRSLIQRLPNPNKLLASCLFLFLSRVCNESERNKMNSTNLAIVFGQILLRPKVESLELLRHAPKISNILRIMIDEYNDLFPRSKEDEKLIAKGELSSIEALIGVPSKKKKTKKKKPEKDEEDLTPEQLKLRNIKQTVDEAISSVLDRLEEMVAELNNTASLEETIEIAKRIRSAKHILFSNPADESSTSGTSS